MSSMVLSELAIHSGVLLGTAALTAAIAGYAYRRRELPATRPFAVLMAALAGWSLTYGLGLHVTTAWVRTLLLRLQWTAVPFITVALFLFVAVYTGTDDFLSRRTVAALGAIPAAAVVGAWTNALHRLMWTELGVRVVDGMSLISPAFGPLFWIYTVYSYTLVAVSVALTLRLVYQSDYLYADQSVLLVVGIAAPFLVNVSNVFLGGGGPKVDYTPVAFSVTGLTFGYALFRRQLFDLVPATRNLGRSAAISQLETGVVIVDTDRRVVYANDAAGDVLGCGPATALGRDLASFVEDDAVDFGLEEGLAAYEHGDRVHEIRTSPVRDRSDRLIGHTIVMYDVTARTERERELARQRDELATLDDLNAVIRGVNQALVAARSREEIVSTVCEQVTETALYDRVCVADVPTWRGEADRWTLAGDWEDPDGDGGSDPTPPVDDGRGLPTELDRRTEDGGVVSPDADGWTVVPLTYGRTVYGAIGLYTDREGVGERERAILGELGETIGHAINAVETERLLSAESLVELEVACRDEAAPLVAATAGADGRLSVSLEGLVPSGERGPVAYLRVDGGPATDVRERLAARTDDPVRLVREGAEDDPGGLLEWRMSDGGVLGALVDRGAHVHGLRRADGAVHYEFDVASGTETRALLDHLRDRFGDLQLLSKRETAGAVEVEEALPEGPFADLTDRQEEVLRAAYRSGYFEWPRDSNAEEVAEALGISSATLHSHLRKAERTVLEDLFERADAPAPAPAPGEDGPEPEVDTE